MHRLRMLVTCLVAVAALVVLALSNGLHALALAEADYTLVPLTGDTPYSNVSKHYALFVTGAYNSVADEYLVVWRSSDIAGGTDIVAQRVSGTGVLLSSFIPITADDHVQLFPVVAYNTAHNDYLIVWCDETANSIPIIGQRVRADGTLIGAAVTLSGEGCGNVKRPTLVYNTARDEYLLAWEQNGSLPATTDLDIFARRFAADTTPIGAAFPVSSAVGTQQASSVAYNSTRDEYLVSWMDNRVSDRQEVYAQRIKGDGSLQGAELPLVTGIRTSYWAGLAYNNTDDQYLVTYNDERTQRFAAQVLDATGATVGVSNTLGFGVGSYTLTSAAYSPSRHEYLVAWSSGTIAISATLQAQRISASGEDIGSAFALPEVAEGHILPQLVVGVGGDKYLAVWSNGVRDTFPEGRLFGFALQPTPTASPSATSTATSAPTRTPIIDTITPTPTYRPRVLLPITAR